MSRDPIRVAQVVGKMVGGGVEQVVMNYYRHINRSKVQFDFIVCEGSSRVPSEEIERLGGRVFEVPPYGNLPAFLRSLKSLFRKEKWKVVHSHLNSLSVFPLCAAKGVGIPVRIAHSHSTWGDGEFIRNAMKAMLRPLSNVYPTYRMACTRSAGEWLFGRGADFEVVYNAIDLSRFTFNARMRSQVRSELGIRDGQLVVLHVGRFMPQKNQGFLIDAFAELCERRADSILLLIGEGERKTAAERKVAEGGLSSSVHFLGRREDVERLYMAADVLCLPSLYEGLGMVAIEAQAAGLPCILSDRITQEVNITDRVRFLPIDNPAVWGHALRALTPGDRYSIDIDDFNNYNIDFAANKITARYLELFYKAQL